jgi:flotillin
MLRRSYRNFIFKNTTKALNKELSSGSFLWTFGYKVANSSQILVKTGAFVSGGIQFKRTAIKFPGQLVTCVNMNPITFPFDIHNMSKEKVEFRLPMVFTVCPINPDTDKDGFMNYALKTHNLTSDEIRHIMGGIIEGETRTFTASMTIEEMFSDKESFKEKVIAKINSDLRQIGLTIINANIKEMADYDEHNKYFVYRKQRAIETANYQAQVDVAEAKKTGELGVYEKEKDIRIGKAGFEQEAKLRENERNQAIAKSDADLSVIRVESKRIEQLAQIEADSSNEIRKQELQKQIEEKRKDQEEAKYRSEFLSRSNVEAEVIQKLADAQKYKKQAEADAELYTKQKEAEGKQALYEAQSQGVFKILQAAGGNSNFASFYLGLERNLYPELAKEAANAINGLQPKMTIVSSDGNSGVMDPIVGMMGKVVPGLDLIRDTFFNSHSQKETNSAEPKSIVKLDNTQK